VTFTVGAPNLGGGSLLSGPNLKTCEVSSLSQGGLVHVNLRVAQ